MPTELEQDFDWAHYQCDGCKVLSPEMPDQAAATQAAIDAGWQLDEIDLCPDCQPDVGRW